MLTYDDCDYKQLMFGLFLLQEMDLMMRKIDDQTHMNTLPSRRELFLHLFFSIAN